MKIVFTGGGTGGHFYPIIAVAESVNKIIDEEKIARAKLYYISDAPYDKELLLENRLEYQEVNSGKLHRGFSFKNFINPLKVFLGFFRALNKLFSIYPDVVFGKGGYASFPTVLAARILNIPVVIHESDSVPGKVNKWAGQFAKRVAVSFKEASLFFPKDRVAWTGHPIRTAIKYRAEKLKALKHFNLDESLPVIFVLGGSQGSELINNTILDALPRLVKKFQIIHQTGINNFKNVSIRANVILENATDKSRYHPIAFLNDLNMVMAAGASSIIVSRAGSSLFEIASWGIPSILIPITNSNGDHQRKNAFSYAHLGACTVIEELNMSANILSSEIERIVENKNVWQKMSENTVTYGSADASYKIARELVDIALSHEK